MFDVGDKVWDILFDEWGEVISISPFVEVEYQKFALVIEYFQDGKLDCSESQRIFHEKQVIIPESDWLMIQNQLNKLNEQIVEEFNSLKISDLPPIPYDIEDCEHSLIWNIANGTTFKVCTKCKQEVK